MAKFAISSFTPGIIGIAAFIGISRLAWRGWPWLLYPLFLLFANAGECGIEPEYPNIGMREIHGMDVYADGGAIHAVLVGKTGESVESQIAYLASKDGGETWSKPVIVDRGRKAAVLSRRGNDAQIAAKGLKVLAAWRAGGDVPDTGPIAIAYSQDGGQTWKRGENPAKGDATQNQAYMDITADREGNFHMVWLDDREEQGNTQGLRYASSKDGGRLWQTELTLDPAACTCCWNRIGVLPDGSLAILYRDDAPHDMRFLRSGNGGVSWRDLGPAGAFDWRFTGCPHCGGGIASTMPGRLLHAVVWSGKENAEGLYYLQSQDLGEHWSEPERIADGHSRESDIAKLANGRLGVVYAGPAGNVEGVKFMESRDLGKHWSPPLLLSSPGAAADHPRILATPRGFRVFWTEKQAKGGRVWAMHSFGNTSKPTTGK